MNNLMTVHTLGPKLIEALGAPKHCTWLELRLAFNEIPTVTCEYYPVGDDGTIDLAAKVLAEYELVPRATPAAVESHRAEAVGFDAWMHERTEATHQAMMTHARLGGVSHDSSKGTLRSAIPGSKVTLRSGGPVMTVIGMTYDGKAVACTWSVDGLQQGDSFPMECLVYCGALQVN